MRKIYFFLICTFLFIPQFSLSQSGIYESFVIIDSGFGNNYYDLNPHTQTGLFDFNGANLGSFACGETLDLNGGQNRIYKCGLDDITSGWLFYRIYSGAPSGAFIGIDLSNSVNNTGAAGCGGINQDWTTDNAGIDILAGLLAGTYSLEVYTLAHCTGCVSSPHYVSNGGFNFTATFTITDVNDPT
ncbi:MAG: hypothetical protein HKO80_05830, partial [Flavobacteriaceae bacterium]|nr:hypothetical protein [Flavobacteriaceae bacterium]